jgi:hypothetical protein
MLRSGKQHRRDQLVSQSIMSPSTNPGGVAIGGDSELPARRQKYIEAVSSSHVRVAWTSLAVRQSKNVL